MGWGDRKSNKIMHWVLGSFEDMGIVHVFQLSFDGGGGLSRPITVKRSTQCIILLLFLLFLQIRMRSSKLRVFNIPSKQNRKGGLQEGRRYYSILYI